MSDIILKGVGVNNGIARGILKKVTDNNSASKITTNDIVSAESLSPPLPSIARKGLTSFTVQADRINEIAKLVQIIEKMA